MSKLDRRIVIAGLMGLPLTAQSASAQSFDFNRLFKDQAQNLTLSNTQASDGIRAALEKGITTAVKTVGRVGGYANDSDIRIPLPKKLQSVQRSLRAVGMSSMVDELEGALNRGAETAAPYALDIFLDVIMNMSVTDAVSIVQGQPTAATNFLKAQAMPKLVKTFTPIINQTLSQTGAYGMVDNISGQLSNIPFTRGLAGDAKETLTEQGVEGGLNGLFHYVGKQEAQIRSNPGARTSDILRSVFGG